MCRSSAFLWGRARVQVEKKDRKRSFRGGIVGKESDKSGCGHTTPQASAVMGAGSVKFVVGKLVSSWRAASPRRHSFQK